MFFKIIYIIILKNTNAKQRLGSLHTTLLKFQELLNGVIHSKTALNELRGSFRSHYDATERMNSPFIFRSRVKCGKRNFADRLC